MLFYSSDSRQCLKGVVLRNLFQGRSAQETLFEKPIWKLEPIKLEPFRKEEEVNGYHHIDNTRRGRSEENAKEYINHRYSRLGFGRF